MKLFGKACTSSHTATGVAVQVFKDVNASLCVIPQSWHNVPQSQPPYCLLIMSQQETRGKMAYASTALDNSLDNLLDNRCYSIANFNTFTHSLTHCCA